MKVWIQHTKEYRTPINLEPTAFASGGEGSLYHIATPENYQQLVAKIYHPKKRTTLRYKKIHYLHQHPPKAFQHIKDIQLVWPQELLVDEHNNFIGFLMPKAAGDKLELLCIPKIPKKYDDTWEHYHFAVDVRRKKRLNLCYKIALAIHQIHRTERYILVDMKPDNIVITPEGNVALVDLDSIEVVENGKTIYDAPVATPEYTPPDSYLTEYEVDPTQETPWDRFGLAVIFYKLLIGVHPYAASANPPYHQYNNLAQKIEHGMFVHNLAIKPHLAVVPDLHEQFYQLPPNIQALFNRSFIDGHHQPFQRPSAAEWIEALREHDQFQTIDETKLEIPSIALGQLPNELNLEQLFNIPSTAIISQTPKIQLAKPLEKKELQKHQLPVEIQDPKQIRSQRFFNFLGTILIVVLSTVLSFVFPWPIMAGLGVAAYFGFNYSTYRNRKSADRRETIVSILNNQLHYFNELIKTAEEYEQKIAQHLKKLNKIQIKNPKEYIGNFLHQRSDIQNKINRFQNLVKEEQFKLKKLKRESKNAYKDLLHYYLGQVKNKLSIQLPDLPTIHEYITVLKRNQQLGKLNTSEQQQYSTDLQQLEALQLQLEIEQDELYQKHLERSQDILFKCQHNYDQVLDNIKRYHKHLTPKEEKKVTTLLDDQRISLQALERLQYDLNRLEKPINDQVKVCRRAQQDAELYRKINYGRHLLEMVGLAKPF